MSHGGKFGFSWSDEIQRAPLSLTKRYLGVATGNIGDAMHRLRMMDPGIKPVGDGCVFAGSAFTVKVPPTDNLMVHVALNLLQPNDVLVVDTGGDISHAIVGEIMTSVARGRGAVAVVIDGAVRDVHALRQMGFPVYARGVCPKGPLKDGPGEVNVTVQCGGLVISPGDIVIGDDDGIAVVPLAQGEEVLKAALDIQTREEKRLKMIAAGDLSNPSMEKYLREKGLFPL